MLTVQQDRTVALIIKKRRTYSNTTLQKSQEMQTRDGTTTT